MARNPIRVDIFDPVSINNAINEITNFFATIDRIEQRIVQRLAEEGLQVASVRFAGAVYAGYNDAEVSVEFSDGGRTATLVADGNSVLFIEFGTGITKADAPAEAIASATPPPLPHGEYGQHRARSLKGWLYQGSPGNAPGTEPSTRHPGLIHTYGNDANASMWQTREFLIQTLPAVYREVMEEYDR